MDHAALLKPAWAATALAMAAAAPLRAQVEPLPAQVVLDRPIEITQGIQNPGNTVPLVAQRTTWVRVYLASAAPGVAVVRGRLRVETATRVDTVPSVGTGAVLPPPGRSDRLRLDASLNFLLPAGATEAGVAKLSLAEVSDAATGMPMRCADCSDHLGTVTPVFEPPTTLRLRLVGLRYRRGGVRLPRDVDFDAVRSWLSRAYPVSSVVADTITMSAPDNTPTCGEINVRLARIRALDLAAGQNPRTRYYGLVRDARKDYLDGVMTGCSLGIPDAPDPSTVAAGPVGRSLDVPKFRWDTTSSYAGWYAGHELAHTLGRRHPGHCDQRLDDPGADPADRGKIGSRTEDNLGLDPVTMRLYNREGWHDVLTYCSFRWISGRTYTALLRRLQAEDTVYREPSLPPASPASPDLPSEAAGTAASSDSILEVIAKFESVEYGFGRLEAAFTAVYRGRPAAADLVVTDTTPDDRLAVIELVHGPGRIRHPAAIMVDRPRGAYAVAGEETPAVETGVGWVHAFIPGFRGEGWIRLLRGDQPVDSIWKSASPPRLDSLSHVIEFSARVTLGHRYRWVPRDPDDADATVTVYLQASFDGGTNWRVMENTRERSLLVPCEFLRGRASVRVRLIASDNVNHAVAYTSGELVQVANDPCAPRM